MFGYKTIKTKVTSELVRANIYGFRPVNAESSSANRLFRYHGNNNSTINLPIPVSKEKIDLQIDTAGTWYLIAS